MAEKGRMTAVELVDKLMGSEHADVVRERIDPTASTTGDL